MKIVARPRPLTDAEGICFAATIILVLALALLAIPGPAFQRPAQVAQGCKPTECIP